MVNMNVWLFPDSIEHHWYAAGSRNQEHFESASHALFAQKRPY